MYDHVIIISMCFVSLCYSVNYAALLESALKIKPDLIKTISLLCGLIRYAV